MLLNYLVEAEITDNYGLSRSASRGGAMIINNIGLVLDVAGVVIMWRAAHFIPRWDYDADEEGNQYVIKGDSPGIQWKRGHNWGLGLLISGFLS